MKALKWQLNTCNLVISLYCSSLLCSTTCDIIIFGINFLTQRQGEIYVNCEHNPQDCMHNSLFFFIINFLLSLLSSFSLVISRRLHIIKSEMLQEFFKVAQLINTHAKMFIEPPFLKLFMVDLSFSAHSLWGHTAETFYLSPCIVCSWCENWPRSAFSSSSFHSKGSHCHRMSSYLYDTTISLGQRH